MIIGNGQLAKAFINCDLVHNDLCVFASGVSNSNCSDPNEFEREKKLLENTLAEHPDKKLIYFSSCALSASQYPKNAYYQHKQCMEDIIQGQSQDYLIFRIPQLFGELKHHNTLINFLYEAILEGREFNVFSEAYRYVIEINDVVTLVRAYIKHGYTKKILNLANPYRYRVEEIVKIFESLLNKKACYQLIEKNDEYELDLIDLKMFLTKHEIDVCFGELYLTNNLIDKVWLAKHV